MLYVSRCQKESSRAKGSFRNKVMLRNIQPFLEMLQNRINVP